MKGSAYEGLNGMKLINPTSKLTLGALIRDLIKRSNLSINLS